MTTHNKTTANINVPDAPDIPGLTFRGFRGESDYPDMADIVTRCIAGAGGDHVQTVENTANEYAHLTNCDPYKDMLFVEVNDQVIGYTRVTWYEEAEGTLIYRPIGFLLPEWWRKGIGRALLRHSEARLRQIAAGHDKSKPRFFDSWASETEVGEHALLESEGYTPHTYHAEMVRPDLDDIPDMPLPDGLEVRPVKPEHYRAIWDADNEAFRDHLGYSPPTEERYQQWLNDPTFFQPDLWKIAWDVEKNEVAGQVRSFINHVENEKHNRKRGHTEFISVRRPYRRRGLAKALIAQSLHELKARGMAEAALGVQLESLHNAFALYESLGFRRVKLFTNYRKKMD